MAAWCERCARGGFDRGDEEAEPCDIATNALAYNLRDPGYPDEWVADDGIGTNARCTAFRDLPDDGSGRLSDARQIEMFA